jgi:hypothetical protein
MRAPAAYSGTCGPGTLVTTRLNSRRDSPRAARAPSACRVGGAKPVSAMRLSAPTACPCAATPRIAKLIRVRRTRGLGSPTGRSTRKDDTVGPGSRSSSARTETGTSARTDVDETTA